MIQSVVVTVVNDNGLKREAAGSGALTPPPNVGLSALNYTAGELKDIRQAIAVTDSSSTKLIDKPHESLRNASDHNSHLGPLVALSEAKPDLFTRLAADNLLQRLSYVAFLPGVFESLHDASVGARVEPIARSRDTGLKFVTGETQLTVKQFQSPRENQISNIACELGVGPRQVGNCGSHFVEEWVSGRDFVATASLADFPNRVEEIGYRYGEILRQLHSRGILYNDFVLEDGPGHSHLISPTDGPAKLVDFGAAVDVSDHRNLSSDALFDILRGDPTLKDSIEREIFLRTSMKDKLENAVTDIVDRHRHWFNRTPTEEVLARDVNYAARSVFALEGYIQNSELLALVTGFNAGYKSDALLKILRGEN